MKRMRLLAEYAGKAGPLAPFFLELISSVRSMTKAVKGEKGDVGPKGEKGDSITGPAGPRGVRGAKGESGDDGAPGARGPQGERGLTGPQGVRGERGDNGLPGEIGDPGDNGSPDTPVEIVAKINQAPDGSIEASKVKNIPTVFREVPHLSIFGTGGRSTPLQVKFNGVNLGQDIRVLEFAGSVTVTRNGEGHVLVSPTGGSGSTTYSETPVGVIDGANKAYTVSNTITTVVGIWLNGEFIHPAEYTPAAGGFTMGTAIPASLSGSAFTITYV